MTDFHNHSEPAVRIDQITEKLIIGDEETQSTPLDSLTKKIIIILSILLCLFEIYTAYFGVLQGLQQNAMHLGFVAAIGFFSTQPFKEKTTAGVVLNYIFAVLIMASMLYVVINNRSILYRVAMVTKVENIQLILGTLATVLVLILCRRTIGWALPVIACIFIAYSFLGQYMDGILFHKGIRFDRLVEQLYLTFAGLFGEPMTVSATYVFMFIFFGCCLDSMGTGEFLMSISKSLVGKYRGGPALMSVFSSALMGTISGSAVANVATTGVFTIPLMKRIGYDKNYAGAVEAVSSSGGQIMPPVMGAGAFLMAEYLGCSYSEILKAAIIPAALYFLCVFLQVYLEARKRSIPGVPAEEIKKPMLVIRDSGYMVLPLIMIIIMLVRGYSPMRAAFWGVLGTVFVACFKKKTRENLPKKILKAMTSAAKSAIGVCSACACAGIVICVLKQTGIGLKFSSAIVSLSSGSLLLALILAMLSSLLLGMGLPTTASYVIQATLVAPALITMGLLPIQAHLFVFYFACMACITPPVALAAYTAAPIADGNAMKIGSKAFKLGLAAFIVPYAFAFSPAILIEGSTEAIIFACLSAIIGCCALAIALTGWFAEQMNVITRVLMLSGALCMIHTGNNTDIVGYFLFAVLIVYQLLKSRQHRRTRKVHT
ncbi:MAG: TRAP transporter permease [Oscillospiraceae bacterium]